jgi:drug/metabolite transporter (DMT)-like permease
MSQNSATLAGTLAIVMWSLLATLTVASGRIPAFQLAAMTFAIGACVGPLTWFRRRRAFSSEACPRALDPWVSTGSRKENASNQNIRVFSSEVGTGSREENTSNQNIRARLRFNQKEMRSGAIRALRQPLAAWVVGVGGLFGYHALYFLALRFAPPAEAGLLNYLWPLLIVLFSALLPGERLALHHVIGAVLGLAGTALLLARADVATVSTEHIPGLAAAFCAAFVWAGYSVMSRRFAAVPTDAVAGFCLVTALLAALCHFAFEVTVWPQTLLQWMCVIALGLGPVGAAFYTWDIGMKRGDIRLLGVLSYATPLLSTGFLILAGFARPTPVLAISAFLIAGGGLIAARDLLTLRRSRVRT